MVQNSPESATTDSGLSFRFLCEDFTYIFPNQVYIFYFSLLYSFLQSGK